MDTHEVLVAARNLIDRRGYNWDEYGYGKDDCPLCPEGAIDTARACGVELGRPHPAKAAVAAHVPLAPLWPEGASLSSRIGRAQCAREASFTKGEILAFFDAAIAATAPEPLDPLHGVEVEPPVEAAAA